MKNKYLKGLLFGAVFALTACNGGQGNFTVPEGGYDGSAVTIKFYTTMGSNLKPILDTYVEKFNAIYPKITVETTIIGSWDDVKNQIMTEIPEGNQPNLAYCYPDHVAAYNLAGAVATLDDLINSKEKDASGVLGYTKDQVNDFIKGYYDEGTQFGDNLMYTLPFSKSTENLYYNKTFFEKNNISVPDHWFSTSSTDTTSVEAVTRQIKKIDPNSIPMGYDSEGNWFITMCEQQKSGYTSADPSNHFLFNNDTNKETMKKFRSWYQEGLITTATIFGNYTNLTQKNAGEKGSIYMTVGSSAGSTYHHNPSPTDGVYPYEVGIAPIPQMDQKNKKVISQGPSICIFKKDNAQEVVASFLFLKYLTTSVEFQAEFALASGYVPAIKSVQENAVFKAKMDEANGYENVATLSIKNCMSQVDNYFTSPAFNGSTTARTQVGNLLVKIISTEPDLTGAALDQFVDKAFADAIEECEYAV